ncbi:MAG: HipA domain-containing protein [Chiayiivirga sp.]|jgi:hypothetical protein|uniref:HipA domain-containing protein n=1 Tax=Chiayiivirga sp. TaxID=2041042 RepID=UPI0025C48C4C|nr:HipA domain-containing protein [Chiayiivirga sp.]MCI1711847.1 HipA domain-containing protein [Chiayiivirga sp.]MCI1729565.1 HipA domain-containing protein [Chiayiivirga sp.]
MPDAIVIDVASWSPDEEHSIFPEGSRDKELLRCPHPPPHPELIANHRYLFKQSRRAYPDQFWAEVVAYRIGLLTGVRVPPAYPAWNSATGVCAALIEWFYGYLERPHEGFLSGGLFMKSLIQSYDMKRGRQHNFWHIEVLCTALSWQEIRGNVALQADWVVAWARMLVFDALIGNTDRHHENWGLVIDRGRHDDRPNTYLAPAFDNGTSLGHERFANSFARFDDPNYLARYLAKGHHHMRWHMQDERQAGHAELLLKLAEKYPHCRQPMLDVLAFNPEQLEQELAALAALQSLVPLSPERARFMLRLTLARRARLANALTV